MLYFFYKEGVMVDKKGATPGKKEYVKPELEVAEFRFTENIACSSCYWNGLYSHGYVGCQAQSVPGTGQWVGNTGP